MVTIARVESQAKLLDGWKANNDVLAQLVNIKEGLKRPRNTPLQLHITEQGGECTAVLVQPVTESLVQAMITHYTLVRHAHEVELRAHGVEL